MMPFRLISPAVLPSGFALLCVQNMTNGLHGKIEVEDIPLSHSYIQWVQNSPETTNLSSTQYYSVITSFSFIKDQAMERMSEVAEKCLNQ